MVRIALKRGWSCRCGPVGGSFVTGMEGMIRPARTWSAVSCVTWDTGGSRCRGGDTSRQVRRSSAGSAWLGRARAPLWVSLASPSLTDALGGRLFEVSRAAKPQHPGSPPISRTLGSSPYPGTPYRASHLAVVPLRQEDADPSGHGSLVAEDEDPIGAAFDLAVAPLQRLGGVQLGGMGRPVVFSP